MEKIRIGKLLIMNQKKWKRFKAKYPHYGELLFEVIVKDLDNDEVLVEMSRIGLVQRLFEEKNRKQEEV